MTRRTHPEYAGIHHARCHCGSVVLELDLPEGIVDPRRCDCSMCRRRGAIVAPVTLDRLKVIEGADNLGLYTFNTHTAQHFSCRTCGIYTHHQRRSNPNEYGFNVACIDAIYPFDLDPVPVRDGQSHPSDRKG